VAVNPARVGQQLDAPLVGIYEHGQVAELREIGRSRQRTDRHSERAGLR
jgi:hypothetical protein